MRKKDKKADDGYMAEVFGFLSICNAKDRDFMSIPRENRRTRDYVRLMIIAATCGYTQILHILISESYERLDELLAFLTIRNDYGFTEKTVNDFIRDIPDAELEKIAAAEWAKKIAGIDRENFVFGDLLD